MRNNEDQLNNLLGKLLQVDTEVEWLEFKENYVDEEKIGEYISALSNSAVLAGRSYGYLIWGVRNDTHDVVGTNFRYRKCRVGNEELEAWLAKLCSPRIDFSFIEAEYLGKNLVILKLSCAVSQPTSFKGVEWIRIGSNNKKLKDFPDKERELWRRLEKLPIEMQVAAEEVSDNDVINLLNIGEYYRVLGRPIKNNSKEILDDFEKEKFIRRNGKLSWDITNLGALLLANYLTDFDKLSHKSVRVVQYDSSSRVIGFREEEFTSGYITSFNKVVKYLMTILTEEELLVDGIRKTTTIYPDVAIRELLGNIIIHQSIEHYGTHPTVEIFPDRIEFTNAGKLLVDVERLVDGVPQSRNERLARFMRLCGICEERGSGYDKIIASLGEKAMLAPKVIVDNNEYTKVILFQKVSFSHMSKADKVWTCYMQACLANTQSRAISNADVRKMFGLDDEDKYKATRVLKDAMDANLLKPLDPGTAPRYMQYVPFWAK